MKNSVAITGLGLLSSLGSEVDEFWQNLLSGRSGIRTISAFDTCSYETRIGGEIDCNVLNRAFSPKEQKRKSKISQMALVAATRAIEDANLIDTLQLKKAGIFIGSSQGGFSESEHFFKSGFASGKVNPLSVIKSMNSAPTTNISIQFGINGPTMTIDTACSSSNHAIGMAGELISSGMLDTAIVGGVDTPFSPLVFKCWNRLRALSKNNDNPAGACSPFSKDRNGTVLGEGAGILVLENSEVARKRGARIYGYLAGYGASSDAFHVTVPNPDGMKVAMRNALERAQIELKDIDMINTHGTGTSLNDGNETDSIREVFGEHASEISITGIKANVGHSLAASGALEAIACLKSLDCQALPPIMNLNSDNRISELPFVMEESIRRNMRYCMSNSFAFGGSNSVLIFERAGV